MMRIFFVYISKLFCVLLLCNGIAYASEQIVDVDNPEATPNIPLATDGYKLKSEGLSGASSATTDIGEVFIALMAILGLIVLLAWTTKRLNLNGVSVGNNLKLQSVLSLGSKEKVIIVEVDGKKLLLGVTSQNVNLLCHLDDSSTSPTDGLEMDSDNLINNKSSEIGSFAQQIKKALAQGKVREDSKAS